MPLNDYLTKGFFLNESFANPVERWATHVSRWLSDPECCKVRYEDLKNNPEDVIDAVSEYLDIRKRGEGIKRVDIKNSISVLPRKGVIGDWENHFSSDDLKEFENTLDRYGLLHCIYDN